MHTAPQAALNVIIASAASSEQQQQPQPGERESQANLAKA
jgi:hypothetical protein